MLQDIKPGTEEQLQKEMTTAYVGIDPTAPSLHIGHLVSVMLLKHLQLCGHKPIVLIGGATGMIGDPSGKSEERNLLDESTLKYNQDCLKAQLSKFLDFNPELANGAEMVNNYDWMKKYSFLDFIREIGKHITVNYMMAKDSVKSRIEREGTGLSFTEFSYQLVQGTDFYELYKEKNCKLQMGGSDQWGNITTGTELIRRKLGGDAFALTCPLIKKSDGKKFGKTEKGNVWLDPKLTSPYTFYQFWINTTDEDAEKYIKIFTLLPKEEIDGLLAQHKEQSNLRILQQRLAKEMTCMVHSEEDYHTSVEASQILFGKGTKETLAKLDVETFLDIFSGVPKYIVSASELNEGINVADLLAVKTTIFKSKGEIRRLIKDNGLNINQEKLTSEEATIKQSDLLNNKYILIRQGKKNYSLIVAE